MKKLITVVSGTALAFSLVLSPAVAGAEEAEHVGEALVPIEEGSHFLSSGGEVTDIVDHHGVVTLVVEDEHGEETLFPLTDDVKHLYDSTGKEVARESFEKGMMVEAYYPLDMPVPLIYPAQIVPSIVIVQSDAGSVMVGKFEVDGDRYESVDGELVVHLGDDTVIVDEDGHELSESELQEKEEWVVFYTVTTRSLPPQTTPVKVIGLDDVWADTGGAGLADIIGADHYMEGETKMIPLRKVAEAIGYTIEWTGKTQTALLQRYDYSIFITVGEEQYDIHGRLSQLDVMPTLKDQKMYVPESVIDTLLDGQ